MDGVVPGRRGQVSVGVFGKLPARGDFIRNGLPRDFMDAWDAWWQRGIAATQSLAGDGWVGAWLEAPAWRFALPPGMCGSSGILGVWMPSVDRVGRYFPLTIAAAAPFAWADLVSHMDPFLAGVEQAGRDAVAYDLTPTELSRCAGAALDLCLVTDRTERWPKLASDTAAWWTEGGPRVTSRIEFAKRLPEGTDFAKIIDDGWVVSKVL